MKTIRDIVGSLLDIKVLYVEDDRMMRESFTTTFETLQCNFTVVESGERALEELQKDKYDLVVTDNFMYPMSGIELARHINNKYKDIPVILISGAQEKELCEYVMEENVQVLKVMEKPFDFISFISLVNKHFS